MADLRLIIEAQDTGFQKRRLGELVSQANLELWQYFPGIKALISIAANNNR